MINSYLYKNVFGCKLSEHIICNIHLIPFLEEISLIIKRCWLYGHTMVTPVSEKRYLRGFRTISSKERMALLCDF